jgi:predicted RNA polymerase sigma factor
VAGDGHPRQSRRLADDHGEAAGHDMFRSRSRHDQAAAALAHDLAQTVDDDPGAGIDHVEDDVLRLMFICCHPALTPDMQTTLTLKLVAGLSAREIARAYLAPESTVTQRISRAKRTLTEAGAAIAEDKRTFDDAKADFYDNFHE